MRNDEECWVLFGGHSRDGWYGKYDRYTIGQPATVAFDPDYVWNNRHRIVGWLHTHPHWPGSPSSTDHDTMKAQVFALGRPLLCCIRGTDGLRAHWYLDDESYPVEVKVKRIYNTLYGSIPNDIKEIWSRRKLQGKGIVLQAGIEANRPLRGGCIGV